MPAIEEKPILDSKACATPQAVKPHGASWLTATIWALIFFVAINFVLWRAYGEEKAASKDLWSGTGSIDLAINGLKALKQRPTVVLLGSSLMMYPFWSMDKERDASVGDIFHHHASHTLEDSLRAAGAKAPEVYSLAIFGQMSSDAYIYVDEFLNGDKKPDYLVFGIAPRDFSDYDLPSPTATFTFKRLVGLHNFDRYADLYLPQWQDRADFVFNHVCFFYARRWRLQKEVDKILGKAYASFGVTDIPTTQATADGAGFMINGSAEERWHNSLNEYRRRYRDIGERDLGLQMGFLDRLLAVCHERKIKVVLMNMPLTDVNRALLPNGFYDGFRQKVKQMAGSHDASYLDLGDCPEFTHEDFWDTTHLNQAGGHILVAHLLPLLSGSKP